MKPTEKQRYSYTRTLPWNKLSGALCSGSDCKRNNKISGLLQQAESHWDVKSHTGGWYQEMQMAQRAPRVCSVTDFCEKTVPQTETLTVKLSRNSQQLLAAKKK